MRICNIGFLCKKTQHQSANLKDMYFNSTLVSTHIQLCYMYMYPWNL